MKMVDLHSMLAPGTAGGAANALKFASQIQHSNGTHTHPQVLIDN